MSVPRQKCVLLIVDGLGDLPSTQLGGRTPLEAAETPNLNQLAAAGSYGLLDPVVPGEIPNTHSGSGMLFGVFPDDIDRMTRGPVEASGAGRELRRDDIALRANFATVEEQGDGLLVIDRRAGRIDSGTGELAATLAEVDLGDGVSGFLQSTDQHRCVLVLAGPGLDAAVSDTDPGDSGLPAMVQLCRPLQPGAEKTAGKINRFVEEAHRRLALHPVNAKRKKQGLLPANAVITRGAGAVFNLDNVLRKRGVSTAVVAGCNTVIGLARILGFEAVTDSRFTADPGTDLNAKIKAVLDALKNNDMVFLHVKAPDLFSHDRDPAAKRDFLERLDEALVILKHAGVMVALAADHTTDSNSGAHTADPVPALLFDPWRNGHEEHTSINFGEKACRNGNMPRQSSHEFLLRLIDKMGF